MREQLLQGKLPLPSENKFISAIGRSYTDLSKQMFQAMWYSYLKNKGTVPLPYWSKKFQNPQVFNTVLIALSDAKWIISHSIPARNWAEANVNEEKLLEYLDQSELNQIRAFHKHQQYVLRSDESVKTKATKIGCKIKDTGLVREGFMKAGNTEFKFATEYMEKYPFVIECNLTKSMDKIAEMCPALKHDEASYDTISLDMLDFYMNSNNTYTRGNNYNDSRGRAISSALGKIGNPISNKDFRAMLVIPQSV